VSTEIFLAFVKKEIGIQYYSGPVEEKFKTNRAI